jgi:hypothetical protein
MIKYFIIAFAVAGLGYCSQSRSADNSILIEQVGSGNTLNITQDGNGHQAIVKLGYDTPVDNAYIALTQQGTGAKSATVEITSGINNGVIGFQDGAGNHTAAIQNLAGSSNNISFSQTGPDKHTLTVTGSPGTTNSGNTVDAMQSGTGSKTFDLTLSGTNGAGVTIQQTGNTANSGSMSIQCTTCGNYSYIRN